jgi:two-component system sensor histidine kinase and response regulator WspE
MVALVEQLHQQLSEPGSRGGRDLIEQVRAKERDCQQLLVDRLGELELFARRSNNVAYRLYREVIGSNMRPFSDGLAGFPRMVRDISRSLGKQVRLEVIGKGTLVDRDILKRLESPLTHILRNAIDHGVETPEVRLAAGKSAEATLRIEAMHRGGMLAIHVADDGRGVDLAAVRRKLVQRQLMEAEAVARLNEADLLNALMLPGFSTAGTVTELSGRGVGLDVVRSMVQEVGGSVRLSSSVGAGTSIHFQLPLTLSVVRTLLVEIAGEPYAFPLARLDQIVAIDLSAIHGVEGRDTFNLDDRTIGLVLRSLALFASESWWPSSSPSVGLRLSAKNGLRGGQIRNIQLT